MGSTSQHDGPATGAGAAAAHLRALLGAPGPYRRRWEREATRSGAPLSQSAVARVLAGHLWERGERSDRQLALPRALKDRVGRALSGQVMTPQTLTWFIEGFGMSDRDAAELWLRLGAGPQGQPLQGRVVGSLSGSRTRPPVPAGHATVALHEHHYLDGRGAPLASRTLHVVRALDDGLTRYPYLFDSHTLAVEVLQGGRAGEVYRVDEDIFGVDIGLARPLPRGETASIEYRTVFRYDGPQEPEFRKAVLRQADNVEIRVQFDPGRRPATVWWCVWDGYRPGDRVVAEEPVTPDAELAVHRYLETVRESVVGFRWEW